MVAFPDDYKSLVPKFLIETMATVGASFVSRINLASGGVVPETKALAKGWSLVSLGVFIQNHHFLVNIMCCSA